MKIALIASCAVLTGCAATIQQQQRLAGRLESPTLCYVVYAGNQTDKAVAGAELRNRGFTCSQRDIEAGQVGWQNFQASRQAQADRDLATGLYLLNSSRPPPSPQVICTTTPPVGGVSQTICR